MEIIKNPDFYISLRKSQFKTPIEVLKKNFKNLQKLIEKNNQLIGKLLVNIKSTNDKNEKIKLLNKIIELQENFNKKLSIRVKQHNEYVNRLVLRIERLHYINDLYNKYSHLSKKEIDLGIPKELQEFYRTENNILIVEYLLRQYSPNNHDESNNPGILLAKKFNLEKYIDIDIILQGLKIFEEIVQKKNLKLLKQWCIENKKNLKIIKDSFPELITSDIEFECDFQEFMEKINKNEYTQALIYAQKNLTNNGNAIDNFEKISKGSSVIWSKFINETLQNSLKQNKIDKNDPFSYYSADLTISTPNQILQVYSKLLSFAKWEELGEFFLMNFRFLYGMSQLSPLVTILSIGGSVLKTKTCIHNTSSSSGVNYHNFINSSNKQSLNKFINSTDCPVCSVELNEITEPLPYSLQTKSNIFDDPVMLPNKNIYSYKDLMFFNREELVQRTHSSSKHKRIVASSGDLEIGEFVTGKLKFPDTSLFEKTIMDPMTGELITLGSLEKVFPT